MPRDGDPKPTEVADVTILDIVLPYYGDVDLMKTAVRSVLNQSDSRWQLTVVDDGEEPGVPEWFASLGHPQVHYERNDHNLGISGNFQKCLDLAKQPYMVMMGCDDIMLPDYVQTVHGLLERYPDATIVHPGVEIIDSRGHLATPLVDRAKMRIYRPSFAGSVVMGGEELAVSLLRGNWMYFPSLCWRSSELQSVGFAQHRSVIQDLGAILALLERGAQVVLDDHVCFQYRRHAHSVSSVGALRGSRFHEERDFFREAAARLEARGWRRAAKAARWHISSRLHALTMLPGVVKQRDRAGTGTLLRHAFRPMLRKSSR